MRMVKNDLFIDDMPDTLYKLNKKGIKTSLMNNLYNETIKDLEIVHSWQEIENIVNNNLTNIK